MPRPDFRKDQYTSTEVAAFLQVDPKSVHNWVEKGHLDGFRTPGNHLRFRRDQIVAFMRRNKYPIPKELEQPSAAVP
jgi:excisionase family DNA binding protein